MVRLTDPIGNFINKMLIRDGVVYEFGSFRVDPHKRTVDRGGENVLLPPRAFDVLLLLLTRRGELVSKGELFTRVWPDTHVEEANLHVMISAIRRAIGDDGRQQKYIQTVSKCGYRFVGEVTEVCAVEVVATMPPPPAGDPALFPAAPFSSASAYTHISVVAACFVAAFGILFLVYRLSSGAGSLPAVVAARGLSAEISPSSAGMWVEKGRYAWNLQTKAGFLQSIEYYQKAIAEDAADAAAYAGLAESYVMLPSYSERNNDQEGRRARNAAIQALTLDDHLSDAHIAMGMVSLIEDRSFARSENEFRRAIELNPASPLAEGEIALCLVAVGDTKEALSHARRAKALDPLSIRAATDLGIVLYYSHRFAEAETEFDDALKLDPYSYRTHVNLGKTYLAQGRFDDARRVLEQAAELANHDPLADGLRAEAEALGGDVVGARSILAALERRAQTTYVSPMSFAFAFAGLGQTDDTLLYLRKARAEKSIAGLFLKVDPTWNALHANPEFRNLVGDITVSTP